ncbi:MAG: IS1 family transposase [Spirochaetes bacterium]|jgi:DNA-directed RNA polymerase subunit RPC12/RpoP|nr:IS1 family transposase [Spirochaetota bacterium]
MIVYCSNCNTAHEVTQSQAQISKTSVIHCKKCDKKIKLQFCPFCGAFYSITFSTIKSGKYRYRCRKCNRDFAIEFLEEDDSFDKVTAESFEDFAKSDNHLAKDKEKSSKDKSLHNRDKVSESSTIFGNRAIQNFSIGELFFAASDSFSLQKMLVAFIGSALIVVLLKLYGFVVSDFASYWAGQKYGGFIITLLPFLIIISVYQIVASIIAEITFKNVFYDTKTTLDSIISFILKRAPSIFLINISFLIFINCLILLFCKIPVVGTAAFAFIFFPVYFISVFIAIITFIGIWFYPPVIAHREGTPVASLKNFLIFIKKHNLALIYMVPVIVAVSIAVVLVLLLIHTFAFLISLSLSEIIMGNELSAIFASMPSSLIKISELSIVGSASVIFRELRPALNFAHSFAGFIIGLFMSFVTLTIISTAMSVISSLSSHLYILMERGLSIDDKKKAVVFISLFFMILSFLLVSKIF